MKIQIITGHFYPQVHPRAFRSTELALEFVKRGHEVVVTNLCRVEGFDYDAYAKEKGITIINTNLYVLKDVNGIVRIPNTAIKRFYRWCLEYFLAGTVLFNSRRVAKQVKIEDDTDYILAISTPFICIYGVSLILRKMEKHPFAVADSGDPFYYSKQVKHAPWFAGIEKRVYKSYRYLTIPTENAIPSYSPLIEEEKIRIIPQGFRMDDVKLYKGERKEKNVCFAYAGVFYWDIRNPKFLFNYLEKRNDDFSFYIYMRYNDPVLKSFLENYPKTSKKLIIKYSLPRTELLYELSKMDFLVNIENISNTQMPSKLIDYGIAGRPVYSSNSGKFKTSTLDAFFKRDYSERMVIDISKYDIKNIVNQYLELYKNEHNIYYNTGV